MNRKKTIITRLLNVYLGQHALNVVWKSGVFVSLFQKLVGLGESSGQVLLVLGAHARGTALVQTACSVHQLQITVVVRRDNYTAHTFLDLILRNKFATEKG